MTAASTVLWRRNRAMGVELLGGCCRVCGSAERLQFDHIDPATKRTHRFWALTMCRIVDELVKLQLLCWQCHRDKTLTERDGREWKHTPTHDAGCMCGGCRLVAAVDAYQARADAGREP